jgi:uncharacterized membrane protein
MNPMLNPWTPQMLAVDTGTVIEYVILCSIILVCVLFVAAIWIFWLRPRLLQPDQRQMHAGSAFDIVELERLRESGRISEEEFRRLRVFALRLDAQSSVDPDTSDVSTSRTPPGPADDQAGPDRADESQQES